MNSLFDKCNLATQPCAIQYALYLLEGFGAALRASSLPRSPNLPTSDLSSCSYLIELVRYQNGREKERKGNEMVRNATY